ncbi:MAG: cyclodeaminase/cyclohydrolase family protein [Coriobacteriia bacterium]|nr:cyclodeaminase/cyclohydrolase family protein [Coriobacteriia bacterium]
MDLDNFVEDLTSNSPAPGGGAASALFGVLGAALSSMVCALTEGRKKYVDSEPFVQDQHKKILELQEELKAMMDADVDAFMQISAAYKLPKETDEEKTKRSEAIQAALEPAIKVPFKIIQLAAQGLDLTESLIGKTNEMASSDLGCAALGFKVAIQGAYLNVKINLGSAKEPIGTYEEDSQAILDKYLPLADKIYIEILNNL